MFAYKHLIYGLAGIAFLAFAGSGFAQTATPEMLKIGEAQFNENCAVCHQADAIGQPGVAPSLTNPELLSVSSDKFFMATLFRTIIGGSPCARQRTGITTRTCE